MQEKEIGIDRYTLALRLPFWQPFLFERHSQLFYLASHFKDSKKLDLVESNEFNCASFLYTNVHTNVCSAKF